jgi:hypothetical protein
MKDYAIMIEYKHLQVITPYFVSVLHTLTNISHCLTTELRAWGGICIDRLRQFETVVWGHIREKGVVWRRDFQVQIRVAR